MHVVGSEITDRLRFWLVGMGLLAHIGRPAKETWVLGQGDSSNSGRS